MMGLFLVFCVRSMNDNELRWSWQYSFNAEQEQCLKDLERLVKVPGNQVSNEEWCPVIHRTLKSFVNCVEVKKMVAEVEWPFYRFLIAISYHWTFLRRGLRAQVPSIIVGVKKWNLPAPQRRGSPHSGEGKNGRFHLITTERRGYKKIPLVGFQDIYKTDL